MGRKIKSPVNTRSGYSECDYPVAITLDEKSQSVHAILAEWRTPTAKHFILRLADGSLAESEYSLISHHWQVKIILSKINP